MLLEMHLPYYNSGHQTNKNERAFYIFNIVKKGYMSLGSPGEIKGIPPVPMPKGTTKTWILTYIIMPLLPFFIGSGIQYITCFSLNWNTFNACDLTISMTLLSIFINQSILTQDWALFDNDDKEDRKGTSQVYYIIAISFAILFALVKYHDAMLANQAIMTEEILFSITKASIILKITSYVGGFFFIIYSILTQRQYKLRGSFG